MWHSETYADAYRCEWILKTGYCCEESWSLGQVVFGKHVMNPQEKRMNLLGYYRRKLLLKNESTVLISLYVELSKPSRGRN